MPSPHSSLEYSSQEEPSAVDLSGLGEVPVNSSLASTETMPKVGDPANSRIPPGNPSFFESYFWRIFLIAIVCAVAVTVVGYIYRWSNGFASFSFTQSTDALKIVDARNLAVLMLDPAPTGGYRVLVERHGQASWWLVSRDDTQVVSAALSPDGNTVAYVTQRNEGEITVVPLDSDETLVVSKAQLQTLGQTSSLGALEVCDWSPVAWNPAGDKIAFYACAQDKDFSTAIMLRLTVTPPGIDPVNGSGADTKSQRQLGWLDNDNLTVTVPAIGSQPPSVRTVPAR